MSTFAANLGAFVQIGFLMGEFYLFSYFVNRKSPNRAKEALKGAMVLGSGILAIFIVGMVYLTYF